MGMCASGRGLLACSSQVFGGTEAVAGLDEVFGEDQGELADLVPETLLEAGSDSPVKYGSAAGRKPARPSAA